MILQIGKIYKHHTGNLYRIADIAYNYKTAEKIIIYFRVDQHGIFQSIREKIDEVETIVNQPFWRTEESFIKNFTFYEKIQ